MTMAEAVDELARSIPGKEQYAIEAFARAQRAIPTILADNAGYDSQDIVTQQRALHRNGKNTMGIDMDKGVVSCMEEKSVTESFYSKSQSLVSAHEAAELILRVDQIIRCAPRQRREPDHGH